MSTARCCCSVLVLALASFSPLVAQQIVGVRTGAVQLVSVGVGTGTTALIGAAATDAASFTPIHAYDEVGNSYYFLTTPTGTLYKVSAATGTFSSAALSGASFDGVNDIEYDAGEGVLYALLRVNTDEMRLATIDVGGSLGAVTLLGTGSFESGATEAYTFSELDPTANRFYFYDGSNLKGVDTAPGVADVVNTGATAASLLGIKADSDSGALYALQSTGAPTFDRRVLTLSTAAGTFGSVLATGPGLAGEGLASAGVETFDSAGNRYFFIGMRDSSPATRRLFAVSTPGLTLSDEDVVAGDTTDPQALEFDSGTLPVELQSLTVD